MTIDDMREKAAGSLQRAEAADSSQDAGQLMLATTLWLICAEVCDRLDGILAEQRVDILEDRERGLS